MIALGFVMHNLIDGARRDIGRLHLKIGEVQQDMGKLEARLIKEVSALRDLMTERQSGLGKGISDLRLQVLRSESKTKEHITTITAALEHQRMAELKSKESSTILKGLTALIKQGEINTKALLDALKKPSQ